MEKKLTLYGLISSKYSTAFKIVPEITFCLARVHNLPVITTNSLDYVEPYLFLTLNIWSHNFYKFQGEFWAELKILKEYRKYSFAQETHSDTHSDTIVHLQRGIFSLVAALLFPYCSVCRGALLCSWAPHCRKVQHCAWPGQSSRGTVLHGLTTSNKIIQSMW